MLFGFMNIISSVSKYNVENHREISQHVVMKMCTFISWFLLSFKKFETCSFTIFYICTLIIFTLTDFFDPLLTHSELFVPNASHHTFMSFVYFNVISSFPFPFFPPMYQILALFQIYGLLFFNCCSHINIWVCKHIYVYKHIYVCVNVYICVCMNMHIYACKHVYICVCKHVCVYVFVLNT